MGVRATFFVPGFTADSHPDVVRAILDAGHEIGHHGYLHEPMQGMTAEAEAQYIDRGLEALDRVDGVVPSATGAGGAELALGGSADRARFPVRLQPARW